MYEIFNPEIPGLEPPNPGISGLTKIPGIRDPGIGIPKCMRYIRFFSYWIYFY
jgi:hypothetical protein